MTGSLERLAKLRATGVISEAEFEQEKQGLLNASTDPAQPQYPLMVRVFTVLGFLTVLIGLFAVIGWMDEPEAMSGQQAANSTSAQSAAQEWSDAFAKASDAADAEVAKLAPNPPRLEPTGWSISTKQDPMNDMQIVTAAARFEAAPFMIEVTATCKSDNTMTYDFAAFDRLGQPANFRRKYTDKAAEQAWFSVRVDNAAAFDMIDPDMRHSNVVQLLSITLLKEVDFAERAARGAHLAVRLPLEDGEATVQIDQSDPALRHMLDSCLERLAGRRQWVKENTTTS